ncbi:TPA: hypothetical protein N6574_004412, partial [Escherichia coli]|nr:hypothetical protein [Escherichia coli]
GDGGLTTAERQRLKELERENRELRRSNDILRQASAYFAVTDLPLPPHNATSRQHNMWFRIRGSFAAARWSAFTGCGVPLR